MTARRADGSIAGVDDIEAQTRQICENPKAAVEAAGGTMDEICRVDVYVRNMEHFDAIHKVRREYFKAPAPASTMVEVCKMTFPDYLIEIGTIAAIASWRLVRRVRKEQSRMLCAAQRSALPPHRCYAVAV
jgi:2-iminobutanoate/2-iminopropanoate deaminase